MPLKGTYMLLHNYNQKYSKVLEYFSSTSPKSEYLLKYRKISKNGTRVPLVLEYHGTLDLIYGCFVFVP